MNVRLLTLGLAAGAFAALAGCDKPETGATAKAAESPGSALQKTFEKPAPGQIGDDPRVIAAKAASDSVARSLAAINERLAALHRARDAKAENEKDLKAVVERLLPMASAARADCDAILRAATDLNAELAFARPGYESAALLYRERAGKFRDPDLRGVELAMAAELDRLAADVPRRRLLTHRFVAGLIATQEFLAEAERCLRDAAAALTILAAGPDPVVISAQARAFGRLLSSFIAVVEKYQSDFLKPPEAPGETLPPPLPRPTPPPPGPRPPEVAPAPRAAEPKPLAPGVFTGALPDARSEFKTPAVRTASAALLSSKTPGRFTGSTLAAQGPTFGPPQPRPLPAPRGSWVYCGRCGNYHPAVVPGRPR